VCASFRQGARKLAFFVSVTTHCVSSSVGLEIRSKLSLVFDVLHVGVCILLEQRRAPKKVLLEGFIHE
jgi:hypothetical protein